jgi:hypothetical protein
MSTPPRVCSTDQVVDGVEVGQVAGQRGGDPVNDRVQQLLTARDHDEPGAAARELLGRGLAEATTRR